jgi:hypothetical protein
MNERKIARRTRLSIYSVCAGAGQAVAIRVVVVIRVAVVMRREAET